MKLLLVTKTEIQPFNVQYLLKSQVIFAHSYEEFLSKLHGNIDSVGFTSKAVNLIATSSKFIPLLEGIRTLYGYNLIYFADDSTDLIATHLDTLPDAYVVKPIAQCSEVDVINNLARDEIKPVRVRDDVTMDVNKLPSYIARLEVTPDRLIQEFKESPKLLRDLLTVANSTHIKNGYLMRQNSDLQSQKLHLLELATKISTDNDKLIQTVHELEEINITNYTALCKYKNMYTEHQSTLDTLLAHGVSNVNENITSSIHVDNPTFPICVMYLKQITHLNYLSTYLDALLRILLDNHKIVKVLRILPKNSTMKLKKYNDYFNTTYGLNDLTYSNYSKFLHLGNPHTILEYMVSNQIPIDVLIVIDETSIDNQYCYGKPVIRYNLANKYTDIQEYDLDATHSIVNDAVGHSDVAVLPYYSDFSHLEGSQNLLQVYNESLPLTSLILHHVNSVLAEEEV